MLNRLLQFEMEMEANGADYSERLDRIEGII
jgi:hypothetical protein